jgi:Flp pilus assembly pilin Flp
MSERTTAVSHERKCTDDDGAAVIEYALLISVIGLALVLQLISMTSPVCSITDRVSQLLGGSAPASCDANQVAGGGANSGGSNNGGSNNGGTNNGGTNNGSGGNGGGTAGGNNGGANNGGANNGGGNGGTNNGGTNNGGGGKK